MQLPNYTQVSNEFIEQMHKYEPSVTTVFLAISRKTIGWHKTSDRISLSQLEKMTGLTKNTIKKAIAILQSDGWITQTDTKFGYVYDLNIDGSGVSKNDIEVSNDDPGGATIDPVRGSTIDPTKERFKETIIKDNNKDVAVEFETLRGDNIIFTWAEVQKLSVETGILKEEVAETLITALRRADIAGKVKNLKGWAISAVKNGWDLDAKEQPGEAEREYQSSRERNERETRTTKVNISAIKKAAIKNPDAKAFFDMAGKIMDKPSIDDMIQKEKLERKAELNKQRITVLKEKLKENESDELTDFDLSEKILVTA